MSRREPHHLSWSVPFSTVLIMVAWDEDKHDGRGSSGKGGGECQIIIYIFSNVFFFLI